MHKKSSKTSWTKNVSCVYKVFQFLLHGSGESCGFLVVLICLRNPANLDLLGFGHVDIDQGSQSLLPLRCHLQFRSKDASYQLG